MGKFKIALMALALAGVALVRTADANTLRWAADTDPGSMDPHSRNVTATLSFLSNIYEGLVRRNRELGLEPALAVSWENTSTEVWRFNLRRNVRFHDGSPFTADDVVFSYERTRGPGSLLASAFAAVREIRKIDDFTVEFVTNGPNPILPNEISSWLVMSKSWSERNNATRATDLTRNEQSFASVNANGTGPFKLRSRTPDGRTVLEVNPNWWDTPQHNLTEVVFTPLANPATRTAALLSGDVDMVYTLPLNSIAQVQGRPGLRVIQGPELRVMFFGMDLVRDQLFNSNLQGRNPFKDIRVRQALRIAIDADQIRNQVMRGLAVVNHLMVVPGINGFDPSLNTPPSRDLAEARRLMTEAGYPDGFEVGMECPNDRWVNDEAVCTAAVSMMARIGIRARLRTSPFSQYIRLLSPPYETSLFYVGWGTTTYDAHNNLLSLLTTRAPGGRGLFNVGGYSNPRVDALTDRIQVELNQQARNGLIREALQIVRDDVAYIPIVQQMIVWAARDNVELVQYADNYFPLRLVRMR
ncbi:MAG: ABC transporter substrate-binding protein [Alphaproteobacteria bacterium]|nr:ABC transporter substrate-binding protein [Alphaproteobacteria bacterium]